MNRVYVVLRQKYESAYVTGVYEDRADAEKDAAESNERENVYEGYTVEETIFMPKGA